MPDVSAELRDPFVALPQAFVVARVELRTAVPNREHAADLFAER